MVSRFNKLLNDLADLSESEALDVFYELKLKHGWQGTVWGEVDLEDMWSEFRRPILENGDYGPDIAKPWHEVRESVLSNRSWTRWFTEWLVEKGNGYLADWIMELDENGRQII
jgi:hypothetical protein